LLLFLLGSLRAFGIGRFLMLEYQKSSTANTKHPQSATCFACARKLHSKRVCGKVAKQRANHFQPQTARVVGTAGDDFCTQHEEPAVPATRAVSGENP
jgi:hypothetical protein